MMSSGQNVSAQKVALITGITGQDGSCLAELFLEKGYLVHAIKRRASSFVATRISYLCQDPHDTGSGGESPQLTLHYCDLADSANQIGIIQQVQPDEIYKLRALERLSLTRKTRIYQASSSELYGLAQEASAGSHAVLLLQSL